MSIRVERKCPGEVRVSVPATSANLGPGFDCLGMALELRNEVVFRCPGSERIAGGLTTDYTVHAEGIDAEKIPDGRENLVIRAAEDLFTMLGKRPESIRLHIINRIPVGSGLGSSAAAIVAGLVGANALAGGRLTSNELLQKAVEIEGHPDNVAPALFGGVVLGVLPDSGMGPEQVIVRRIDPPPLAAIVVLPTVDLSTSDARTVLPPTVTREEAVSNLSRVGFLIHSLMAGEYGSLRVAMGDRLHQPHRMRLIPGSERALAAAYDAGALGVALSGAGPSLIALAESNQAEIKRRMVEAFAAAGLTSKSWVLTPSEEGCVCRVA